MESKEYVFPDFSHISPEVLYIAGPYRASTIIGIHHNIQEARRRMEWAWVYGFVPICPHTNSAFTDGLVDDSVILKGYLHLVSKCDAILRIRGWEESKGAVAENELAMKLGLRVVVDPYEGSR